MTDIYLPEGRRIGSAANLDYIQTRDGLRRAAEANVILEGRAVRCDAARNLLVELGFGMGVIPRSEAAAGDVRDIAVISQVGKPVCFKVHDPYAPLPILSRKEAQDDALEYFMCELEPGDVLPIRVTHLEPFGAFVDMGCGVASLIGIENISVSRISHPSDRFRVGQEGYAAVLSVDCESRRVNLTHRELLGTWEQNAERFEVGETVAGIVRGIEDYGAFIELTPNLSGLTERRDGLHEGDGVSVYIKSINTERMKIKLLVIDTFSATTPPALDYYITGGRCGYWRYSPDSCAHKVVERYF